ncbi:MAG TPA: hypothetical protein VN380_18160 [Thermoanaerobaculia bacterium]|jgi:hypothetical protein|nr:hypothetical protein [Thermoanaerobaculia bacterium]
MPRYTVNIRETYDYQTTLEAPSEAAAELLAKRYHRAGYDLDTWEYYDNDSEVTSVIEAASDAPLCDFTEEEEWLEEHPDD